MSPIRPLPIAASMVFSGLALTFPVLAAEFVQDFENDATANYSALKGRNAEGSKLEVTTEKAHQGKQSLKLNYVSTGGYIEFTTGPVKKLDFMGDKLQLSMWVHGTGRRDFVSGGIRFVDKNNETFQFAVPGMAEAMASEGWKWLQAEIDLTKNTGFWGDNSDGKLDRPFGYLGLAATRNAQTAVEGTVYIDELKLTDGQPNLPPAPNLTGSTLQLTPSWTSVTGPASEFLKWVAAPGKPVVFTGKAAIPAAYPGAAVRWKVLDGMGETVSQGEEKFAGDQTAKDFSIRLENPPRGVLYASAVLLSPREEVATSAESRMAVMTPRESAVPIKDFVWGVAAHVGRNNGQDAPDLIALMRLLGFAAARSDMTWSSIQPAPGVWDWESHDRIYANFKKEGIMPMPLLAYGTRWATTGDPNSKDWHQWFNAPPNTEAFATYASEAVKRYKNQTRYWEIWNEPDIDFWLGTVEQYSALVDATVPAIKAQQPDALVMNGGFSEVKRRPNFIPDYLKLTKNRPEIFAIHTHGGFENLLRAETTVNANLAGAGLTGAKRPKIFLNEAGYSHARGVPEKEQAVQLVKKMAYSPAAGFSAYVWYDLRDDGTDPNENEHNFGLVKADYRPKASAVAAEVLLDTIGTRTFRRRLPIDASTFALIYGGSGRTVLTAWRQSSSQGEVILPLVLRAKNATGTPVSLKKMDIFGNATPVPNQNGLFLLPVSSVPQYIVAEDENAQFELAGKDGRLLKFSPAVVLAPGEKVSWPVTVDNPFPTPLKASLTVAGQAPVPLEVGPTTSKTVNVPLTGQGTAGTRSVLPLTLTSPQLPVPLTGASEIQIAYLVPGAPDSTTVEMPRSGLVSLFEATPMQNLHFKDAGDLSARIELQKTEAGTRVRVIATDQTHFVVADPALWWQGDSIQWAVGMPDGRMWEWMGTLLPEGPQMRLSLSPDNKTGATLPVSIRRDGTTTVYEWLLPKTLPSGEPWPSRFNFDFIVNDNDGDGRKGWVEWTPGIGMEKNPAAFVPVVVK